MPPPSKVDLIPVNLTIINFTKLPVNELNQVDGDKKVSGAHPCAICRTLASTLSSKLLASAPASLAPALFASFATKPEDRVSVAWGQCVGAGFKRRPSQCLGAGFMRRPSQC